MGKKSCIPYIEVHCPFCDAAHLYKISERYRKENGALLPGNRWKITFTCPYKHYNKTWVNVNSKTFTVIL